MAGNPVVRRDERGPFKASGRDNGGRFDLFVMDIIYGFGPPLHTHTGQEDSFYVVDGVLTVQIADEIIELRPGDFASAAPGVPHSFTNTDSHRPARMINLMTPGIGFDEYVQRLVGDVPPEPDMMEKLNEEFGVQIVGPSVAQALGL